MVEAFANDPIALRQLIAYEALGNIPPFDGYKNMCKRIGDGLMEYIDYEFWYMRFARGEMDMEFDGRWVTFSQEGEIKIRNILFRILQ